MEVDFIATPIFTWVATYATDSNDSPAQTQAGESRTSQKHRPIGEHLQRLLQWNLAG
jgi:hypothetical protein